MRKKILVLGLCVINLVAFARENKTNWTLHSPDNAIVLSVFQDDNSSENTSLFYTVEVKKANKYISLIAKSPLGLERNDASFGKNLKFKKTDGLKTIKQKYYMHTGRKTNCISNANQMSLYFCNSNNSLIRFDFRVSNDGVAFRYAFPEKSKGSFIIRQELTGFSITSEGKAWIQPYDKPTKWTPGYENYYKNAIPIGSESPNKEGWAFPVLFQTGDLWALISESGLDAGYCGIRMESTTKNGMYRVRFPEKMDGEGTGNVNPESALPWVMPWRTIIISRTLAGIFNSTMITDLAKPAIKGDFSWVKPGRASWSWLTDNDSPQNFETLKKFVDLSVDMKWEYSLIDANWDLMKGGDIEQLVKYANARNVGILLWYNSGGPHNTIAERPRDIIFDSVKRNAEFAKLQKWGVKGLKIDFWQSDKQNLILLYEQVLKDASNYKLLVNLHGCTIPRGWARTYPNLVSQEAVKGEEAYLFDSLYSSHAPVQNTILPFTRNVLGTMDYTPFVISNLKFPHHTTYAHELALTLIHNSGVVHFGDNEKVYSSLPDFVKEFLTIVPTVFDETQLLSGYPGEHIVIAARKGTVWYLAGINSLAKPVNLNIDGSFIKWENVAMKLITDSPDVKNQFTFSTKNINSSGFEVQVMPYGGFVAVIR